MRLATRLGLVLLSLSVLVAAAPALAQDEYPFQVKARYAEIKRGSVVRRMVFAEGIAPFPDRTKLRVSLRLEDEPQNYLGWHQATVRGGKFFSEMGPWTKEFISGVYVIEAWYHWADQTASVRAAILKSEEGQENGTDNCRADVIEKGLLCESKAIWTAGRIEIGTPARREQEEEEARARLTDLYNRLLGVMGEAKAAYAQHAAPDKAPETDVTQWMTWAAEWNARLQEIDEEVFAWRRSKMTVRRSEGFLRATNAMMALRGLVGRYGADLYGLDCEFGSAGAADTIAALEAELAWIHADLTKAASAPGDGK